MSITLQTLEQSVNMGWPTGHDPVPSDSQSDMLTINTMATIKTRQLASMLVNGELQPSPGLWITGESNPMTTALQVQSATP